MKGLFLHSGLHRKDIFISTWSTAHEGCTVMKPFPRKKNPSNVKEITDKTFNYTVQSRMEWDWMMIHPQHKYYAIEKH